MKELSKKEILKAIRKYVKGGIVCVGCKERFSPFEINSSQTNALKWVIMSIWRSI